MNKVGWIGLGKLGLTCALVLEQYAGVEVIGYDTNPGVRDIIYQIKPPHQEVGLPDLLARSDLTLADDLDAVIGLTDGLVFCAVQTPHAPEYGGERETAGLVPRDFDYSYLVAAAEQVSEAADRLGKDITLVVVSTCLPGTLRRHVLPILSDRVTVVYNPFFIAMGTTMQDFLQPEFILIGTADGGGSADPLVELYTRMHGDFIYGPQIELMSLESAELTKVAYNTFISLKIVFANTLMEICDMIPQADVDSVTNALTKGTDRITSGKYLTAGMGDGGACHPRDNIAMSHLARALGLSTDPFEFVTRSREDQSRWLARIVDHHYSANPERPVVLLGKAYKPDSDLIYGSPALLLASQLDARGLPFEHWDEHVGWEQSLPLAGLMGLAKPSVWVICTRHPEYSDLKFPNGSLVIDPFRCVADQHESVEVLRLGEGKEGI